MNSSVEEIKSRINVVDLIGEYIKLNKAGTNYKAPCPFHNEKTPSFMVSEEKQIWHCFGCGKGGDAFGFLMELEGLEFKEVLKILADKAGVQLPSYNPKESSSKNKALEILELATKFYEKQLWEGSGKEKILKYLHERGLKDESIKEFRLGYAPDGWNNIIKFLLDRGYKLEEIVETGLLVDKGAGKSDRYYDRFRDRIIFPIADSLGKIVGYSARVAPGGDESQAKYVNTPETTIYHKSKVLYGIDKAKAEIKSRNFTLLVEGNTDVIAAYQAGIKNTVAVSGTALTPDQLDILKRYSENIKMLFDMDEAGNQATLKSAQIAFQKEFNVSIIELSEGKDAAEVVAKDPSKLLEAIEKALPAMEHFFNKIFEKYNKTKAQDKKTIAKELLNIIGNLNNEIEKSHWIKKLAQELDVEEKILLDILSKEKRTERRDVIQNEGQQKSISKSRVEVIREKIIGLVLADEEVWKKIVNREPDNISEFLEEDELLSLLIERGADFNFKFDNAISELNNEALSDRARILYFNTKYDFDIQQGIQENSDSDNLVAVDQYIKEVKRELCKRRLETISRDLKKAEESGDKEAVSFLMKEFSEISSELM